MMFTSNFVIEPFYAKRHYTTDKIECQQFEEGKWQTGIDCMQQKVMKNCIRWSLHYIFPWTLYSAFCYMTWSHLYIPYMLFLFFSLSFISKLLPSTGCSLENGVCCIVSTVICCICAFGLTYQTSVSECWHRHYFCLGQPTCCKIL